MTYLCILEGDLFDQWDALVVGPRNHGVEIIETTRERHFLAVLLQYSTTLLQDAAFIYNYTCRLLTVGANLSTSCNICYVNIYSGYIVALVCFNATTIPRQAHYRYLYGV